jgi:hypothetical protein
MARPVKPEKIVESLQKLYEKRKVLDQQILEAEKSLVAAAQSGSTPVAAKGTGRAKKRTASPRKPSVKKQ